MLDNRNFLLYPLSLAYGIITEIRNFMYNSGILISREFDIPVICIGNITIGGTGKTPHTEYFTEILSKHFKVAVLSRGYKRKTADFRIITPSSTVSEAGDEPLQIAKKFPDLLVVVESNRIRGIDKILELRPDTEVVVMDDGFQHRSLKPGFSILLSDFGRPMQEDHLIPFGSLRERADNMQRADIILITKTPPNISAIDRRLIVSKTNKFSHQNLYFTAIKYLQPVPVFENINDDFNPGWNSFSDNGAVLVTGIANPLPLVEHLKRIFSTLEHLAFPDHHDFSENDIKNISDTFQNLKTSNRYVITTEKDAMRLREFANIASEIKSCSYYIPVGIEVLNEEKEELDKQIIDYVRKNKRNNRLPHQ
ncbi:MAG TPA: tetraacyldisaccharide 4'-kinase [Bacteroidales bacterium]|nr:tetraacyldisaccharide 4'-kinase [Bacteroidales bacterium]